MKKTIVLASKNKARELLLDWSAALSHTYGMNLFLFPQKVQLALFPYQKVSPDETENPWTSLQKQIQVQKKNSDPSWLGYLSYEMGADSFIDAAIPSFSSSYPLFTFLRHALSITQEDNHLIISADDSQLPYIIGACEDPLKYFRSSFWDDFRPKKKKVPLNGYQTLSKISKEQFNQKINQAKSHIRKGDAFQINLSQSIQIETSLSPFNLFRELAEKHLCPFSAYLNYKDFQVISVSPERFLMHKGGKLQTRPIKGTCAVHEDPERDRILQKKLYECPKENAELTMVTDLMRNDLGRVSEIGSVQCTERRQLMRFSTLHHTEAVIESQALPLNSIDLIRQTFPPGSITGCPKVRVMQLIAQLEQRARHLYCGSIGYIEPNGDFDLSVAIRTAVYSQNILELQVGSGLTIDSDAELEYEETWIKALAFLSLLKKDQPNLAQPLSPFVS